MDYNYFIILAAWCQSLLRFWSWSC